MSAPSSRAGSCRRDTVALTWPGPPSAWLGNFTLDALLPARQAVADWQPLSLAAARPDHGDGTTPRCTSRRETGDGDAASGRLLERARHAVLGERLVRGATVAAAEAPAELDAGQRRGAPTQEQIADQVVAVAVQLEQPARHLQVERLGVLGVHLARDVVPVPVRPGQSEPVVLPQVVRTIAAPQPRSAVHDDAGQQRREDVQAGESS